MSSTKGNNSGRSENHDWHFRMNRLNDQIVERRNRRDERFHDADGLSPQRSNSGSRNLGYEDDEGREINSRQDFRMPGDSERRYQRNGEPHHAVTRGQFVERSRMYQIPNNEDRRHNHHEEMDGKGYKKSEFRKERRDDHRRDREMDEIGYRETESGKGRRNDPNYQEIDETGYRESEFRKEGRDNRNHYQEMHERGSRESEFRKERRDNRNHYEGMHERGSRESEFRKDERDYRNHCLEMDERGYRETEFCNGKEIDRNGRAYPENMEMGYVDRGLPHPKSTPYYPAPNAQYIDRGSGVPQSNMQYQPGTSAWNTQVPFTVQHPPVGEPEGQEEKEEKKPRKRWWYTTSRVFSAALIISSLVSDWLQYSEMNDPISEVQKTIIIGSFTEECKKEHTKDETNQFLYFTIAGTVLAVLQLANIIYQIVQNHRIPIDKDIKNYLDERTEVFLINAFVKFPQTFLMHRYEVKLCVTCSYGSRKQLKSFLNGLSSVASSIWRYLTHLKVSAENSCTRTCSNMFERCAVRLWNCIKSCLLSCIKCICPCCCCCFDCKTFLPCCCMYVKYVKGSMSTQCVCQGGGGSCKMCDPDTPSIFAELASIPTGLVTFLFGLRVAKYFCIVQLSGVISVVFDTIIGYLWNFVFK